MVDISRIDKLTKQVKPDKPFYSDFFVNFNNHPETKALLKNTDDQAIKRAIRNLIFTEKGEAPYQPRKGCNLRAILFEEISVVSENLIRDYISDTLNEFEPRIRVNSILIAADIPNNSYEVSIIYEIKSRTNSVSNLNLTLNRVR